MQTIVSRAPLHAVTVLRNTRNHDLVSRPRELNTRCLERISKSSTWRCELPFANIFFQPPPSCTPIKSTRNFTGPFRVAKVATFPQPFLWLRLYPVARFFSNPAQTFTAPFVDSRVLFLRRPLRSNKVYPIRRGRSSQKVDASHRRS